MNANMATINNHNTESYLNEKQTVLIVDDSKVIRLALNKILKNDFAVLQANDGEDAWEKLQENDAVSAIFSDVSMPNLDGFGLLERVRTSTEARIADLPFIIITANDDNPEFSAKVSDAGGNALITKPFKTNEIKACIQDHIVIEQTTPSVNTPAIPDHEVAEILGIDGIETAEKPDSINSTLAENEREFTLDENFFSNSREAAPESRDEPTTVASLEPENLTSSNDSDDLSSMADIDFSFDENILNETLDNNASTVEEFEFTIDEEFLNKSLDSAHTETTSEIEVSSTDSMISQTTDWSEPSFTEDEFKQIEDTPAPVNPKVELSLEPVIPSSKHKASQESKAEKEEDITISDLEQARQHAMEVAQEKVQPQQNVSETGVHQTTEREQIRARLQQIREQEKQDLANARNARRVNKGNSTSLFSKLGRIISGLFGSRKK